MVLLFHRLTLRSVTWLHSAGSLPRARMSTVVSHPLGFFSHVAPHHSVVQSLGLGGKVPIQSIPRGQT